jgi:hypothetical protein
MELISDQLKSTQHRMSSSNSLARLARLHGPADVALGSGVGAAGAFMTPVAHELAAIAIFHWELPNFAMTLR